MKYRTPLPSQDELRELFDYADGTLVSRLARSRLPVGRTVGHVNHYGYVVCKIKSTPYYVHRLIWVWHHGDTNGLDIDHIDGCRSNNLIENLRLVNRTMNNQNLVRPKCTNKVGLLGVSMKFGKFCAQINANGKVKHLGSFDSPEEAQEAYLNAKRLLHPGCTI